MATRRDFLKGITLIPGLIAGEAHSVESPPAARKKIKPGIQLWSVRSDVSQNVEATLSTLASHGYRYIEPYGFDGTFYGLTASEFRKMCSGIGLKIISSHTSINASNATMLSEKAAEAGLDSLVLPSFNGRPDKSPDDFRKLASELNQIGKITAQSGVRLGYHNHSFEFAMVDGMVLYDLLLTETDPILVDFQMDIYWIIKAGYNPVDYFNRFPGRFRSWHCKDMGNDGESCIVGNGKIPFIELMEYAKKAGLKQLIIEQEHYSEGTPLDCAARSLKYVEKNLL